MAPAEITVGGTTARRPDGTVLPRPVDIGHLGRGYIRPLPLFKQREYLENRPDNYRTLADMFAWAVVAPGFDGLTAADVQRLTRESRAALRVAVFKTAGLWDADDAGDADTEAGEELTAADRINTLHELGYEFPELYGLLTEEIKLASEGARRHAERQREEQDRAKQTGDAPSVETSEGTRISGGPAEGVDRVTFVDADGAELN